MKVMMWWSVYSKPRLLPFLSLCRCFCRLCLSEPNVCICASKYVHVCKTIRPKTLWPFSINLLWRRNKLHPSSCNPRGRPHCRVGQSSSSYLSLYTLAKNPCLPPLVHTWQQDLVLVIYPYSTPLFFCQNTINCQFLRPKDIDDCPSQTLNVTP